MKQNFLQKDKISIIKIIFNEYTLMCVGALLYYFVGKANISLIFDMKLRITAAVMLLIGVAIGFYPVIKKY